MAELDKALGITTSPTDLLTRASQAKTSKEFAPILVEAERERQQAIKEEEIAARKKEEETPVIKGKLAKEEADYYQKVDEVRKRQTEQNPLPELKINQDTLVGMATLGSMIGVLGQVLGNTGGKQSALNSINAMSGMMAGYQQGKKDFVKVQQLEFEKNFQVIKAKHEQIQREFEAAIKKMPYDLAGAKQDMEVSLAKLNSDFLSALYKQRGATSAYNAIKEIGQYIQKAEEAAEKASVKSGKVSQQQFIIQRAVNSLGGVASAVESIQKLPAGSTTGLLPNLQTKDGMTNYVRNTLGRKISSRDAEFMNTLFTGIGRNLASIEASGTATGLTELAKQMQSGLYINAGIDDPYKVAIKLADIRRIAIENIMPAIESQLLTPEQSAAALKLVHRIEKAVPYETSDVIEAARKPGKKTIGEQTGQAVFGKKVKASFETQQQAKEAKDRGEIEVGDKISIGGVTGTVE